MVSCDLPTSGHECRDDQRSVDIRVTWARQSKGRGHAVFKGKGTLGNSILVAQWSIL